jgi:hypothetical protein
MKIPRVFILLAFCLPILSGCGTGEIFGPTQTITPIPYTSTPMLPSARPNSPPPPPTRRPRITHRKGWGRPGFPKISTRSPGYR